MQLNLKTAVGSPKSTQALGAPGKSEKPLITNKVTTSFSDSPCTPIAYASFSRPTAVSRLKKNIRRGLTAATCTLLGAPLTGQSVQAADEGWAVDSSVLIYSEADNRVSAIEPVIEFNKEIHEDEFVDIKLVLDTLSGASPNGASPTNKVQTFTRPSGNGSYQIAAGDLPLDDTFRDTRGAVSVNWDKPLSRLVRRQLGVAISQEFDYTSLSVNGLMSRDFNHRNTTLQGGVSVAADDVRPIGGIPVAFASMVAPGNSQPRDGSSDTKTTLDLLLGVTQVLGHDTIGQINYTFSDSSGYLTDPFKILSVVDGATGETRDLVYENRPDQRVKHSFYAEIKHFLSDDVINASFRYYTDDWGIDSQTADLSYRWKLGEKSYLQPRFRWYQQTAADFYHHSLSDAAPLPAEASADPRLGDFSATTVGLKFGYKLPVGGELSLRGEYYQQSGDDHPSDAIGIQKQFDLFPETKAIILQVGYSVKW